MAVIALEKSLNALNQFSYKGIPVGLEPYGNGHINDTFVVVCRDGYDKFRYILQSINTNVFPDVDAVMSNITYVTEFLRKDATDERSVMTLVPLKNGDKYYKDEDGRCWRLYVFIEDSLCLERPESKEDFYQCAVAFGDFVKRLNDFPVEKIKEIIKDFHNTPKRFENFLKALEADKCNRAASVKEEIDFIKERAEFYSVLVNANKAGELPLRVTHNDTKSNNVMLDSEKRTALCVIDLDTIMPGFSVNDFGDSIRFGASTAAEDEKDLNKVRLDVELFKAYADGFITAAGGLLKDSEIMLLPEGAKMMTIECGMRFLTDYLEGDTYFKTAYAEHNLDRCRTQLKLVKEMEDNWDTLKAIVGEYTK